MKTYTYLPNADVFKAKSKKAIATYLKNNTRGFENDTIKQFMKGYSDRSALLGRSIRFDKEENFINDLFKSGDLIEGNVVEKVKKAFQFKKKLKELDEADDKRFTQLPIARKKQVIKAQADRRAKRRAEGSLPKTYLGGVKKKK
jgi:hypothetical protein